MVNLSLGGSQEGGPLDQAIDRITKETGTLFVIAAGNFGVVESPGTAASASSRPGQLPRIRKTRSATSTPG